MAAFLELARPSKGQETNSRCNLASGANSNLNWELCPLPSKALPIPTSIRSSPTVATGGATLCHGPDKELGFQPLVFHPCHLFSRPRTRRTQRPGARVEGGVVICRPGRHWVETEQCCMYTSSPGRAPLWVTPPPSQDHPCNPPSLLALPFNEAGQDQGNAKEQLMGKCEAIWANKPAAKLEPTAAN